MNNSTKEQDDQALKQMYKSAIKASYFGGMNNQDFMKKSRMQIDTIAQNQGNQVDENTFTIMRGYKRPDKSFLVFQKSTNVFAEKAGFCCFGARRQYRLSLQNSRLLLKDRDRLISYVDFDVVSSQLYEKSKNSLIITFETLPKDRSIYIEFAQNDIDQMEQWKNTIAKLIAQTNGKQNHFTYLARKNPFFYKNEHILNEEFQKLCNTGDIILFNSPHGAARLQRTITASDYDHVGVLLRNHKNQLFVYESSSEEGVGFTPWKDMIRYQWYDQTNKIAWRPLQANLKQNDYNIIEAFVAKTLGKGFQITVNKLFTFKTVLRRSEEEQKEKTYFCSQLVARLYKQLGFLDQTKSSSTYYPSDFSEKNNLKFIKPDVSLGREVVISFDVKK